MKDIVQEGHDALRAKAQPVPEEMFASEELYTMLRDMEEALAAQPDGVALAAPQIALPYRIFIVRFDRMLPPPPEGVPARSAEVGIFINPEFVKTSRKWEEMDEGCLSVRGVYGTTLRHERATVRARSADGTRFERGGGGILAQAYQHEIDHLDGILFIDHAENLHELKRRDTDHA